MKPIKDIKRIHILHILKDKKKDIHIHLVNDKYSIEDIE